jgi:hypothetical protein
VNLLAEDEGDRQFLEDAFDACEDYDLSWQPIKSEPDEASAAS